jgi:nicotinamidase-related amidase
MLDTELSGYAAKAAQSSLRDEPLGSSCVHVCVDMQRLFGEGTPWTLDWMPRILPNIVKLCEAHAPRTIFTRFIPARRPGDGRGVWRRYYQRWASMTIENIGWDMVDLVPDLQRYVPPAETVDKPIYSPWLGSNLRQRLEDKGCDTVIVSGGETDVCVLATVLGAADLGYRTIVVQDALCSSSDEDHDAMLQLYDRRYGQHIETTTTDEILERLRA